jgi:Spy/CpxP family protein refolding chaperone
MKKAIFGIALATCITLGASAQDQSNGLSDHPKRHHRGDKMAKMEQLNLTDQQKTELKTINEDYKTQMTDLKKSEDKITVAEWKSKMATIRKDHHEKVEKVLTDEQKANLKKMRHENKHEMRKHGGRNLEHMKKELNLTDDQVNALKKNREDMAQKFKAMREDKNLSEDQKKAEMKEFRKQQHESLKSILTPEQLQKLEQQKKHHNRRHQTPVQS